MKVKFSIIFLLFILNLANYSQDLRVLTSNKSSIVFEYRPTYKDTAFRFINGEKYYSFSIPGTYIENFLQKGETQKLVKQLNIGVPSEFGNTIQILAADFSTIQGKYQFNPEIRKDSISASYYYLSPNNAENAFDEDLVTFGDFGLVRALPVQTIKIYPIQFDKKNNTIKIYNKILFSINYSQAVSASEIIEDELIQNSVLNWEVAKNWGVKSFPKMEKSLSIMNAGPWYKFETSTEGVYRIDRAFLQNLGIDVNTIDPKTIKIFGNGGYALPENYIQASNKIFQEVAITVFGEQDGRFDSGDYILFYGRGVEFWEYSSPQRKVIRIKHPYTKKNFYWLTFGGANGKRMSSIQSSNFTSSYQQPFTLSYKSNDKDSINIGKTGRDYFGDELNLTTKTRTYLTTLNGISPSSKINYKFRVANASTSSTQFRVDENNNEIYSTTLFGLVDYTYGIENTGFGSYAGTLPDERSNLKFSIITGATNAKVMIDYFEIEYQQKLQAVSDNLILFSKDTTSAIKYVVASFSSSNIQAYDVSDYANVKLITDPVISGGQITFQMNESAGNVKKYLALTTSAFKIPTNGVSVPISNVKSNISGSDVIVITHKDFKTQAERYANYRSNLSPNKLNTSIFYVDEILNEFSGSMLDPTAIRDFLKYAYDNWQKKPLYVLLFGDGDFDYLNTIKETSDKNFVPPWQTVESLDEIYSYNTDDYYARVSGNDIKVDLAIGRLTFQTQAEADILIDKIIAYENNLEKGLWRTKVTLVADDGPAKAGTDDGSIHTYQSENLSHYIISKFFDQQKLYLAAYPTAISGLGRRKPDVNRAIVDAINNGTLLLNYIGHGNPTVWAHENVFEKATTIPQLKNPNYFFLTAATCDFGKFDDPTEQSSTEIMIAMRNAGSIGTFTATRVVFSYQNAAINDSFYTNLLSKKEPDNLPIRIGKAYFLTKQFRTQDNDEKFHLFCDPTLRLAQPVLPTVIDSVNHKSLSTAVQINALGTVNIKGQVKNLNGSNSNFSGEAIVSVYDSERQLELKEMYYTATMQGGLIYRGRTVVTNGKYETEFVVPKDISYENKNGKIATYIFNQQQDGVGFTSNVIVGGTNPNAINDGKGPEIEIFFDTETSESAYLVNPDFTLIAKLNDQTGLNTTGTGIGHKLEGILNDDENNSIDFTNYFVGDLNSGGKSGVIKFKFSSMKLGDYKLKVKAWDVFNNFSSQEAYFSVVSPESGITVRDVYNFPNPFSSFTTFTFQHNLVSSINVKIKVYTITGRLIKEIEQNDLLNKFVRIDWDGRDSDGNEIGNGTYLYKLSVESSDGLFKDNVLGKLAIIK